jgi:hypothetical protein
MGNSHQKIGEKPLAHRFLDYNSVYVHFIYAFTWDISKITWEKLGDQLKEQSKGREELWEQRQLHERQFSWGEAQSNATYQPTLVTQKSVFEITKIIGENINLLIPSENGKESKIWKKKHKTINVGLKFTTRLFDNGVATCTFVVKLDDKDLVNLDEKNAIFENIHYVQHLAHNVDSSDESRNKSKHLTYSYIEIPSSKLSQNNSELFPQKKEQYCSLHEIYYQILKGNQSWIPPHIRKEKIWASEIKFEKNNDGKVPKNEDENEEFVIKLNNTTCNFQSPFLFTVAEIEESSYNEFFEDRSTEAAIPTTTEKEVASILCKLTLDNDSINDFHNLSDEYLNDILRYKSQKGPLGNLCLDQRLFFTISRRGAIALTASLNDIPSFFVIPSFLNLCEIFRARWYLGSVVSARLDRALVQIARSVADPAYAIDPLDLMEPMFRWRTLAGAFLRNPVPFLFDGGSVTEIAEIAEDLLWLNELGQEIEKKFELLDKLVRDYLNIERQRDLKS